MPREREMYLWDIMEAIDAVSTFTRGFTFQDFVSSALVQAAVERKVEVVGEAIKQMETSYPGSSEFLPDVRRAIGMRNHLAHGYFATDLQELWLTAKEDLEPFKAAVRTEMARLRAANDPA